MAVLFLSNDAHTFTLDVVTGLEKHAIEQAIHALGGIVENKVDPQYVIQAHDKPTVDSLYGEIEFMMKSHGFGLDGAGAQGPAKVTPAPSAKQPAPAQPSPAQPATSQGGMGVTMTRHGITVSGIYSGGKNGTLTLLKGSTIDMAAAPHAKDKGTPARSCSCLRASSLCRAAEAWQPCWRMRRSTPQRLRHSSFTVGP